jgi:hypothetical protein
VIVTFTSQHNPDIVMFGDVATKLLHMMGHSGTVPGAIRPEDLPDMLQKLKDELTRLSPQQENQGSGAERIDGEYSVPLPVRAGPLIDLLESALEHDDHVMWK